MPALASLTLPDGWGATRSDHLSAAQQEVEELECQALNAARLATPTRPLPYPQTFLQTARFCEPALERRRCAEVQSRLVARSLTNSSVASSSANGSTTAQLLLGDDSTPHWMQLWGRRQRLTRSQDRRAAEAGSRWSISTSTRRSLDFRQESMYNFTSSKKFGMAK
eukprot:CAMPEP_0171063498 /NCGR_PEP_ID=MMETSP0766_2-20121228/5696_1 /TAXON_ID=439317 /ORGANISM="Gambierdiscus australes, Strain CAWD 149" /LENGTH=165 /DNA_ID=CAMNT_0011519415 /DNA_START=36 /DNA_END=533 /DNA_ORIENTATION=+